MPPLRVGELWRRVPLSRRERRQRAHKLCLPCARGMQSLQAKQTTFLTTLQKKLCGRLHVGEGGSPGTNSCAMLKSIKAAEPLSAIQMLSSQMSSRQIPAAWISASACALQEDGLTMTLHWQT